MCEKCEFPASSSSSVAAERDGGERRASCRKRSAASAAPAPSGGSRNRRRRTPFPPAEALERLMQGNARYVAGETECKDFSAGRADRAGAQYPIVGVLSCADSRVSPELIFEQGPGDVFVVRVAGNFVNIDGLASMEYAVKILGVPLAHGARPHELRSDRGRGQGGDGARGAAGSSA